MTKDELRSKMMRSLVKHPTPDTHNYSGYLVDPTDSACFQSDEEVDTFIESLDDYEI